MRRIMTIVGLVFLVGCSIIFYSNYIAEPNKAVEKIYVDTCFVDSNKVIVDTLSIDSTSK